MDSLFLTDKRLRNSINGIAVTEYKVDTKNLKRRNIYYALLKELGIHVQDGEIALEARKTILKRRLVLQWHMMGQLREEFSAINGVCMIAMPLNEPRTVLEARLGYIEPTKRQHNFLKERYKFHEKRFVDINIPMPLFSYELLKVGLEIEEVLCQCGEGGQFLYAPGKCLKCHPMSSDRETARVWKSIWEQLFGECSYVYHTARGCYLKARKINMVKTEVFQKKLEMVRELKPRRKVKTQQI